MSTEHLIQLSNGRQFTAPDSLSVLDAAAAAGLVLEHSCRTGRCGACRTHALQGTVAALMPDLALSEAERSQGWFLSCASKACSDLRLDTEDLGSLGDIKVLTLPARIDALQPMAEDVLEVTLRLPPNQPLRYLSGQYINVMGPQGIKRAYSIANAPRADGKLQLHIKRVSGGAMSHYWFSQAKLNDLLRFEGPRGSFFLRDVAGATLILLATGTGFAPIQALLQELGHRPAKAQPSAIWVYWGARQASDLYANRPELPAGSASAEVPLHWVPVLSRADEGWQGERGHVQDAVLRQHPTLEKAWVFACGSDAMIKDAQKACQMRGLPPKRFLSDAFVSA